MRELKLIIMLFVSVAGLPLHQRAGAQYATPTSVLGNGGAEITNSSYRMLGTVGQPTIGVVQNSSNANEVGYWYQASRFLSPPTPPPPWTFTGNTNNNAIIAVPFSINPTIGTQPLQTGDAIGLFFEDSGNLVCAGFGLWQQGQNLSITAWGDDAQTTVKDGFAANDLIHYKIWDAQTQKEYTATATYQTGGATYTSNGVYVLSSLKAVMIHNLALAQGWNLISSFVEPIEPQLEKLFTSIQSDVTIMKNGAGQVFWPSMNINQIGSWNFKEGYQVLMKSAKPSFAVTGAAVVPETTPLSLGQGWNMVAYLRNTPMSIATALAGIVNNLVIVKNGAGQVYWPAFNINQIGSMQPGQGYQMFLAQAATLTYPANSSAASLAGLSKSRSASMAATISSIDGRSAVQSLIHFTFTDSTGHNAVAAILAAGNPSIDGASLVSGDEIGVFTPDSLCVGAVVWQQGENAAITVWGDDDQTQEIDGIRGGEQMHFRIWRQLDDMEFDSVSVAYSQGDGIYASNGIYVVSFLSVVTSIGVEDYASSALPKEFRLSQNHPNPFNPSTTIGYQIPTFGFVSLKIYNLLGKEITTLVNEQKAPGRYNVQFVGSGLPSGIYFYRLEVGDMSATNSGRRVVLTRKFVLSR